MDFVADFFYSISIYIRKRSSFKVNLRGLSQPYRFEIWDIELVCFSETVFRADSKKKMFFFFMDLWFFKNNNLYPQNLCFFFFLQKKLLDAQFLSDFHIDTTKFFENLRTITILLIKKSGGRVKWLKNCRNSIFFTIFKYFFHFWPFRPFFDHPKMILKYAKYNIWFFTKSI